MQTELLIFRAKFAPSGVFSISVNVRKLVQAKNLGAIFPPFTSAHRFLFALFALPHSRTWHLLCSHSGPGCQHLPPGLLVCSAGWSLPASLPFLQYPLFSAGTPVSSKPPLSSHLTQDKQSQQGPRRPGPLPLSSNLLLSCSLLSSLSVSLLFLSGPTSDPYSYCFFAQKLFPQIILSLWLSHFFKPLLK